MRSPQFKSPKYSDIINQKNTFIYANIQLQNYQMFELIHLLLNKKDIDFYQCLLNTPPPK